MGLEPAVGCRSSVEHKVQRFSRCVLSVAVACVGVHVCVSVRMSRRPRALILVVVTHPQGVGKCCTAFIHELASSNLCLKDEGSRQEHPICTSSTIYPQLLGLSLCVEGLIREPLVYPKASGLSILTRPTLPRASSLALREPRAKAALGPCAQQSEKKFNLAVKRCCGLWGSPICGKQMSAGRNFPLARI